MIHDDIIGHSTVTLVGNWWWVLPQRVCLLLPVRCGRCECGRWAKCVGYTYILCAQ